MTLTQQARNLYRAIDQKRKMYARWRETAYTMQDRAEAQRWQEALIRIDRIADKALTREFRREDKGL